MPNPKRESKDAYGRNLWYPYYAGFSPRFALSVFDRESIGAGSMVCDPWNGAGTTTWAAQSRGISFLGADLNPVMAIVAKAKLARPSDLRDINQFALKVIKKRGTGGLASHNDNLLSRWLPQLTVNCLLEISDAIWCDRDDLVNQSKNRIERIESLSSTRCLLFLALFRASRKMVDSHKTSNPTWRRMLVDVDPSVVHDVSSAFLRELNDLTAQLAGDSGDIRGVWSERVAVCSSTSLKSDDKVFDLIVTSPPYCTRIDYAVATMIELGLLGFDYSEVDRLRRTLMGTTTVPSLLGVAQDRWGVECCKFLDRVRSHPSRASSGYYYKSHVQYFADLYLSIGEIHRVLKPGGRAYVVVQDSQYKEVHNDLATIVEQMSVSQGLDFLKRSDFPKVISLRTLNSSSRKYSAGKSPVESVLVLKRPE